MEKILVKADKRSEIGKGEARSLRRMGVLPAVVQHQRDDKADLFRCRRAFTDYN